MNRLKKTLMQETAAFHPRLLLAQMLLSPLPLFVGNAIRTRILRLAGFKIGPRTVFWGTPTIVGSHDIYRKLVIGSGCLIGPQQYFDLADQIIFGDDITVGPQCMFITGTHAIGASGSRAGMLLPRPVCIGSGVWFGARCTILPGVTIGPGAVIAAGSVVTKDLPPHTLAAGVPAVVKRVLEMG
jgi:maltose O-acetyltransferase